MCLVFTAALSRCKVRTVSRAAKAYTSTIRLGLNLCAHLADAAVSAVLALANGRFSVTKANPTELIGSGHIGPQTASSLLHFPSPA